MRYWIPGYWEWVCERYVQSLLIFGLTFFSILSILKTLFFSDIPNTSLANMWVGILFFCALWHGAFVVISRTQVTLSGGNIEDLYEKARLASLKGNTDLALFYFERMHQQSPKDEDVTYQLGKVYLETGKTGKAKKLFRKYLSQPGAKWKHEVEELMREEALV